MKLLSSLVVTLIFLAGLVAGSHIIQPSSAAMPMYYSECIGNTVYYVFGGGQSVVVAYHKGLPMACRK